MSNKVASQAKRKLDFRDFVLCGHDERKPRRETARERRLRQIAEFHDALVGAKTMAEACRVAGITPRTGARWIRTNEFAQVYSERRRATIQAASGLLKAGSIGSTETLSSIAIDPEQPATARVAAARAVLDSMLKITEIHELEQRLAKIEAASAQEEVTNA